MKKLALTLALSLAGIGAASAQTTSGMYDLGAGRLVFKGGLTTSGCDVVFDGDAKGTGDENNYTVDMPNGLSYLYLENLPSADADGFDNLKPQVKRSAALNGKVLSVGIKCPADVVAGNILNYFGNSLEQGQKDDLDAAKAALPDVTNLIAILDARGVLAFYNSLEGDEGGFVNADVVGGTKHGVLNVAADSGGAQGVGIAFLRTDDPGTTGGRKLVNLDPIERRIVQQLEWKPGTMNTPGGNVVSVDANAKYDFAYVNIGGSVNATLGDGSLTHIVSFRFQYDSADPAPF